jgi:hypothetical protein
VGLLNHASNQSGGSSAKPYGRAYRPNRAIELQAHPITVCATIFPVPADPGIAIAATERPEDMT